MKKIISKPQVKGRQIHNYVLIANECLNSKDEPRVLSKLEIDKAYDHVS